MLTTDRAVPPREITITRIFNAPRELVFKTWTEAEHLAKWWGPKDYTTPVCEVDLRPGGRIRLTMQGPDGELLPSNGYFREIDPPKRLVFITTGFELPSGEAQLEVINTATFEDLGGKTKMTLHAAVIRMTPDLEWAVGGMNQGWSESLDKLEALFND